MSPLDIGTDPRRFSGIPAGACGVMSGKPTWPRVADVSVVAAPPTRVEDAWKLPHNGSASAGAPATRQEVPDDVRPQCSGQGIHQRRLRGTRFPVPTSCERNAAGAGSAES